MEKKHQHCRLRWFHSTPSRYKRGYRACVGLLLEKGASETVLDALGRAPSGLMPEGFESGKDHDADMSSDGQFELEEKRDILSLHPSSSSSSGHGVLDVDGEKSVNNGERVCQVQSGQMDGLASTPKASAAPRPIDQLQLEAKSIPSKQTLSAIVERPFIPLGRHSNTHAHATAIHPSIHIRLPHQSFQPTAISPNQ